ncbi:putative immunity protein, partial [Streptomyces sp. NPDC055210]
MTVVSGDLELTMDELRVVAHYALESAVEVLPVFEEASPGDPRPRAAVDAAREFVSGARRTKLQRVTSLDAHRAAKEAPTEAARLGPVRSITAKTRGVARTSAALSSVADAPRRR